VLCGGNHDYILERMGNANAKLLCKSYGVDYLCTEDQPVQLSFDSGLSASVWGSGMSAVAGLDATRAVKSGNAAYQFALPSSDEQCPFAKMSAHLAPGSVDIMLTHGPPEGMLLGAKGKSAPSKRQLISRVQPSLYVCGHSHTDLSQPLKEKWTTIDGGGVGVTAAVLATWNNFFGAPMVIDRVLGGKEPMNKKLDCVSGGVARENCSCFESVKCIVL